MQFDLSHTPGILYAISYWLSGMLYAHFLPARDRGVKRYGKAAFFLVLLAGFMALTDRRAVYLYFLFVGIEIGILLLFLYSLIDAGLMTILYYCARAFVLGEFVTSLCWQLYYYTVRWMGSERGALAFMVLFVLVYGTVFGIMLLLENGLKKMEAEAGTLEITRREVAGTIVIVIVTYGLSNISFALANTPFSMRFSREIFIMRTLADLAGVVILSLYHMLLVEVGARTEAEMQQQILQMQYSNYQASEESIELINQKYHDLKHQIAALRFELGDGDKYSYLQQMEEEIRQYEAENKTGNRVLDIILTSKSLVCQKNGISLNVVADGKQLAFMSPMDLSSLFGNALDNAIRGAEEVQNPEERLIRVAVAQQMGFVHVNIENRYGGEVHFEGKNLLTTKNDRRYHGYGVKSIRRTVEKYGGTVSIKAKEGWFILSMLFPQQGDSLR